MCRTEELLPLLLEIPTQFRRTQQMHDFMAVRFCAANGCSWFFAVAASSGIFYHFKSILKLIADPALFFFRGFNNAGILQAVQVHTDLFSSTLEGEQRSSRIIFRHPT
mmetsp:Transcript_15804/g.29354  ORF Transcript_15804/g.29354 Transcript_15804/m.29354 type:complete len:108 (+) Transcript_15804:1611-1934(+)